VRFEALPLARFEALPLEVLPLARLDARHLALVVIPGPPPHVTLVRLEALLHGRACRAFVAAGLLAERCAVVVDVPAQQHLARSSPVTLAG
jgi:hypothetical protein